MTRLLVPIVRSKLRPPPVVVDLVGAERLLRLLEAGREQVLTLLAAPPGYGKTLLAVKWLETRQEPSAWLSLDREDSDLLSLLCHLVAAVRGVFPESCTETQACLDDGERVTPVEVLSAMLSNDLDRLPAPLLLVLDGYERVDSPLLQSFLDGLLAHPPRQLRWLITTRQEPQLALAMLRVRQAVLEIGAADLRLNEEESARLFVQASGRIWPPGWGRQLWERTQGWPAGVRLFALALCDSDGGTVSFPDVQGGSAQLQRYFQEEVLARLTPDWMDLLMKSALVDRFCAALGDAIAGDASSDAGNRLVRLAASGALLCDRAESSGEWYQYHPLFREFLRCRLAVYYPAAVIGDLHGRAANWLQGRGLFDEAMTQVLAGYGALAAGEFLVRHHEQLIGHEQRDCLRRCLKLLPPEVVLDHADLLIVKAWLMYHEGYHTEIAALLDRVEALSAVDAFLLREDSCFVGGHLQTLRSLQAYLEGRAEFTVTLAEEALRTLPAASGHARVLAQTLLALGRQASGNLSLAREGIQQALAQVTGPVTIGQCPLLATLCLVDWMAADLSALNWSAAQYLNLFGAESEDAGSASLGRFFLGLVQYQRNDLVAAESTLLSAVAAGKVSPLGYRTEISFMLAAVYQALGQTDRARETIAQVVAHLEQRSGLPALFRARACQADLALRQGRLTDAVDWANTFDPGPVQFVYRFFSAPHLTLARVWIAEGSAEARQQAVRLLHLLEVQLRERNNSRFLAEVLALQALLQDLLGNENAALEAVGRAVALAQPGGLIRLFVDLGPEIARPLRRLESFAGRSRFVTQLLAALDHEWLVNAGRQPMGGELTRREIRILKLLAARLSNIEISQELCISRATVKRHTQNIYRKLHASSRREAVVRARSLKILADSA